MPASKNSKEFLHPLTDKWTPLINRFALRHNYPLADLLQESYILEWHMQKDPKVKKDGRYEFYFRTSLYRQLKRRVCEWGWHEPRPDKCLGSNSVRFGAPGDPETDITESLIQMRSFDEVYYDQLVEHVAVVIKMHDWLAAKIFLDRMKLQLQWKELRLTHYKRVSRTKFHAAVRLIKSVVRQEVCFA